MRHQHETYNTSARSRKAAAGTGAADRAAAVGGVALDAESRRKLAEAAVQATQPERHASTSDPSTWSDYATALAAVQAGHADGITYILTERRPVRRHRSRSLPRHQSPTASTSGRRTCSTSAAIPIRK